MTLFIISWFFAGFISVIWNWFYEMRGEEFNPDYFDIGVIGLSFLFFILGYISLILSYFILYANQNKPFTKLIYKLANIGIDKKEEIEEGEEQ